MDKERNEVKNWRVIEHYYGDIVRKLFIAAGLIMAVTLPFFQNFIPEPIFLSILSILLVTFFAGTTNPRQRWTIVLDACVAAVGLAVFEYYAVTNYGSSHEWIFWTNQLISLIFLFSFYFASKTLRSMFLFGPEEDRD
jgi:hypothetical protein